MSRASEAHAAVQEVFASLAPAGATLEWDDESRLRITIEGSLEGMSIDPADSIAQIRFAVADRVQTIVMESAQRMIPPCPRHPDHHPLECRVVDDRAVWRCPQDGGTIRPV